MKKDKLENIDLEGLAVSAMSLGYAMGNQDIYDLIKLFRELKENNFEEIKDLLCYMSLKLNVFSKLLMLKKLGENPKDLKILVNELRTLANEWDDLIDEVSEAK